MIAPRRPIRFRDEEFAMVQRGEAWVIEIAGAEYFLTAGTDPEEPVRRFLRGLPKNTAVYPRLPANIATQHFPVIINVDGQLVRAHPALVPRDRAGWSKTYVDPRTGQRVLAVEGPVWMFAARGRESGACGTATAEQTVDDVTDLAKIWLRSTLSP